jgi:hypothetical protein
MIVCFFIDIVGTTNEMIFDVLMSIAGAFLQYLEIENVSTIV